MIAGLDEGTTSLKRFLTKGRDVIEVSLASVVVLILINATCTQLVSDSITNEPRPLRAVVLRAVVTLGQVSRTITPPLELCVTDTVIPLN